MLPSNNGYTNVKGLYGFNETINEVRVLPFLRFQHFVKIYIISKLIQIFPPDAECEVMCKGYV